MAISSVDGAINGARPPEDFLKVGITMEAVGVMYTPFYQTGKPGAAVAPAPGLSGAALTTYAGQLPFVNPGAGNSYLNRLACAASLTGTLFLVDRLWHNSGFTVTTTTAQTVTSAAFPARDRDGSTNGENVMVGIEVSTATTNAGAITNMTLGYTNAANVASRVGTIASFPATATQGTFIPFQLATGDTGVRSIQSLTLGTSLVTGVVHLVAYRILAQIGVSLPNVSAEINALTGGFPRLYDNTVPQLLWLPTATTAVTLSGAMHVTQG